MLRTLRIILALLVFAAISLVFVDFTGTAAKWLAFLPKYQLVSALLALNVAALLVLVAATLLLGRAYCSVLCPLGIAQDFVIWLRRITAPKRRRRPGLFRFAKERKALRYCFLVAFVLLLVGGLASILPASYAALLDPYSIFGRITASSAVPAVRAGAAAVAEAAADRDVYLFDAVPAAGISWAWAVAIVAAAQLIIVVVMAWRSGRVYCNTVCPVGTLLGFLSRFSLLKPRIDLSKCNSCGSCGRHCKAQCIDTKNHAIDYSRCIDCMDCIGNCSQHAISYSLPSRRKKESAAQAVPDAGRRAFIGGVALIAGTGAALAADKVTDGGLAPLKQKSRRSDAAPAVPPGAVSLRHLRSHCTACQLCISACPSGVLRPSTSPDGFMQPVMVFTDGFCRPECVRCSEVCPTGAIIALDAPQKSAVKIGTAIVDTSLCISAAYGQTCGNCASRCPVHAIHMVRDAATGNMRPTVDAEACIGCGSCEYHCPSGTAGQLSAKHAAIYVDGLEQHRTV